MSGFLQETKVKTLGKCSGPILTLIARKAKKHLSVEAVHGREPLLREFDRYERLVLDIFPMSFLRSRLLPDFHSQNREDVLPAQGAFVRRTLGKFF